jgi:hypothetical protein
MIYSKFLSSVVANDEIEGLKLKLSAMQAQADDQSKLYESTILQLKNDSAVWKKELEAKVQSQDKYIEQLVEETQKLRDISRENIRGIVILI